MEECSSLNGCETGAAKITKGYRLSAKYIIHTVGPIWKGGNNNEDEFLASCYRNSLTIALEHNLKTIAFPSISTGIYRFPVERAVKIAVNEARIFLNSNPEFGQITFVCFDEITYNGYTKQVSK